MSPGQSRPSGVGLPSRPGRRRIATEQQRDVPVGEQAQFPPQPGHQQQVVGASDEPRRKARASECRALSPRPGCARARPPPLSCGSGTGVSCRSREWRPRCAPRGAPGGSRAGRSGGRASRCVGIGDRRAVADRPHGRPAGRWRAGPGGAAAPGRIRRLRRASSNRRPAVPAIERKAELGQDRAWLDTGRPHDRARRNRLPVGEQGAGLRDLAQGRPWIHLDTPSPQLSFGELREALGHLLHDPLPAPPPEPSASPERDSGGRTGSPPQRSPGALPVPPRPRSRRRRTRTRGTRRAGADPQATRRCPGS